MRNGDMHMSDVPHPHIILIPDCGPLLALYRQKRLDCLFLPFASLAVPDAVVHHLVRFCGEEGRAVAVWLTQFNIAVFQTRVFNNGQTQLDLDIGCGTDQLADLCLKETMENIARQEGKVRGIFLLDDYKCLGDSPVLSCGYSISIALNALDRFLAEYPALAGRTSSQSKKRAKVLKTGPQNSPKTVDDGLARQFRDSLK